LRGSLVISLLMGRSYLWLLMISSDFAFDDRNLFWLRLLYPLQEVILGIIPFKVIHIGLLWNSCLTCSYYAQIFVMPHTESTSLPSSLSCHFKTSNSLTFRVFKYEPANKFQETCVEPFKSFFWNLYGGDREVAYPPSWDTNNYYQRNKHSWSFYLLSVFLAFS
jgi:hypothetical protein